MRDIRLLCLATLVLLCGCAERVGLAPVVEASGQDRKFYVVRAGDTLYSIAWEFDKDYRELAYYNRLNDSSKLVVDQKIYLTSSNRKPVLQKQSQIVKVDKKKKIIPRVSTKNTIPYSPVWNWPASGAVVKSFSLARNSKGVDISGRESSPVYASKAGRIAYSGNGLSGYGNLIIIRHSGSYLSAYAHNRRNLVREGQIVKARQKIADMGKSKGGKGLLHFEIRRAGKPVNPLAYLKNPLK